jgi:hypothetical protein
MGNSPVGLIASYRIGANLQGLPLGELQRGRGCLKCIL